MAHLPNSEAISHKVIVGVLLMLLVMPLLEYTAQDQVAHMEVELLQLVDVYSADSTRDPLQPNDNGGTSASVLLLHLTFHLIILSDRRCPCTQALPRPSPSC